MSLRVTNDVVDSRGRVSLRVEVDGYAFGVTIGTGQHSHGLSRRGTNIGFDASLMALVSTAHDIKKLPRSQYAPGGIVELWLGVPTGQGNIQMPPYYVFHREDWRLAGSGLYGAKDRMMSDTMWQGFQPALIELFGEIARRAANMPPQLAPAILQTVIRARSNAEQYQNYADEKQREWLAALDNYTRDIERVKHWYDLRGLPSPEFDLQPTQ